MPFLDLPDYLSSEASLFLSRLVGRQCCRGDFSAKDQHTQGWEGPAVKRSCWFGGHPGSVAVIVAVALMMLMSLATQVRALALPDCTSFPNWNSALAEAAVQGNIAAGALLHDFNADNSLQKIQTGFRDLGSNQGHDPGQPARLPGCSRLLLRTIPIKPWRT